MRLLLTLTLVAAAAWAGYWFLGANGAQSAFAAWFEQRRAEGWAADYSDLQVRGFPNRFDATFDNLTLADPGTGLAWDAPFFQILALSYKPNHVIAIWPNDQLFATPLGKYRVTSSDMRASAVFQPDTDLALERATLTASTLGIKPTSTQTPLAANTVSLAIERQPGDGKTYRMGLSADNLAPSVPWVRRVDPKGTLPETLSAFTADFTVAFDTPWTRSAIETARPQPREIRVKLAQARWGQLDLRLAGKVVVDDKGLPTGQITIKARNWRDILQLAVNSGALIESLASPLEDGLDLIAQLSGNPETLDIPLDFRNGRMLLGPVPLGPAPVLAIR